MDTSKHPKIILIGASAGGLAAFSNLLPMICDVLPAAVIIVQHMRSDSDSYLCEHLDRICKLPVHEAEDKMVVTPGHIYIAPPGYHLLLECDAKSFALSVDEPVNYSRPSIDVLFESAARAWGSQVIGIVLTGANKDGANGLVKIKEAGGIVIVQDPNEADYPAMPKAAIRACEVDHVARLEDIGGIINEILTVSHT